ncbi:hypothetical protein CY0110_18852 [Crocosphaera chwakensis CCY0110]|uniref:Uncharacterized protein n=1 Tax=Crocosphaera chwakensis CCY0110 TaxID=391612 RepID=A3IJA2_9CHRO|nr:hypothetical protein CY0110_18852 [Crocosphaera chwakensis CCY0110]
MQRFTASFEGITSIGGVFPLLHPNSFFN